MDDQRPPVSENKLFKLIIKILYGLQIPKLLLHLYLFSASSNKRLIEADITRWLEARYPERLEDKRPSWLELVWLLWRLKEYRNLFYYRIKRESRLFSRVLLELAKLFCKECDTLFLDIDELGAGLFLQHGYAANIGARKIGKNCWINQQVVIGFTAIDKKPTLGNNVHVATGARVLGDIVIGDNVVIGANAVVVKDVPPNCTVVGVPAYIIKRDGKKVREEL